jgi:predicted ATPase
VPEFLALLVQAHAWTGRPVAGLELLAEVLDRVERTGGRWLGAELRQLRGELPLASSDPDPAASCFRRAVAVAREQDARLWELRAATSLGRLWQDQGRRAEARDLLAPIYGWFPEGFDAPDLVATKRLVDGLRGGSGECHSFENKAWPACARLSRLRPSCGSAPRMT